MAPFTKIRVTELLLESTGKKTQATTYTTLLGLRNLSTSGRLKFEGAHGTFYKATQSVVDKIANSYNSRDEVQEIIREGNTADGDFKLADIESCLTQYGPSVWQKLDGRSAVASTEGDELPKDLDFSNKEDYTKIRTYVYGLILQRACHKLEKKAASSCETIQNFSRPASNGSDVLPPDPDLYHCDLLKDLVSSRQRTTEMEPNISLGNRPRRGFAGDFRAAEAPMIHNRDRVQTHLPQSSGFSSDLFGRSVPDHRRDNTNDEADTFASMQQGPVEDDETQRVSLRKRRRDTTDGSPGNNLNSLRSNGRLKRAAHSGDLHSSNRLSYPSPSTIDYDNDDVRDTEEAATELSPPTQSNSALDRTGTVFNGLPRGLEDFGDDNLMQVSPTLPVERTIHSPTAQNAESEDEVDSVQGSSTDIEIGSDSDEETSLQQLGERPSKVIMLKLNYAIPQLRIERTRLALYLPEAFDLAQQQPKLLEETIFHKTIKLIEKLRVEDTLFRENFGNADAPYQQILSQWLEFVGILTQFRRNANFHRDQDEWKAELASLNPRVRFTREKPRLDANVRMAEWCVKYRNFGSQRIPVFSRDVTHVLIGMADWKRVLLTDEVEELKGSMTVFNKSILTWFGNPSGS